MVTPADMVAQPTYIKIGDNATFVWNYTSLVVTPTAIDVVAYRRARDLYYTITGNQSVEETGSVIWNTAEYEQNEQPLEEDIYTFMVYDSAAGPTAMPGSGRLGWSPHHTFGMYKPKEYTPLAGMICLLLCCHYKSLSCANTDHIPLNQIGNAQHVTVVTMPYRLWSVRLCFSASEQL
jgi:hypothetical protein